MAQMVKWKYRELDPSKKYGSINNYINYVEKQVEERRGVSGAFALSDHEKIIGCHDDKIIKEKVDDPNSFNEGIYLKYIDERKGSSGSFSDKGEDLDALKESLTKHKGPCYIPIVSLKEDEARMYGLDTEAAWIDKGRQLAEEYRKILNIPKENFHYIAAFHTKPEADQNKQTDSGCQPHLHFMMWEDIPSRRKYALTQDEIDKVHERTANVLSKDYMKQFYDERNRYKEQIVDRSKNNIESIGEDIRNLVMDINELTGCSGRMTVGRFEKCQNVATSILDKLENNQKLSPAEEHYSITMKINDTASAKRAISNYGYVLDSLDDLTNDVMSTADVTYVLEKYQEVSEKMREAQPENVRNTLFANDVQAIQREVKNSILKEVKNAAYENRYISDGAKAMLYDKVKEGTFDDRHTDLDTFDTTTTVIATLCKSMDIPKEEAIDMQELLLYRSLMPEYIDRAKANIAEVYDQFTANFGCTSHDFYQAMKSIRAPITRHESQFRASAVEPYDIAARTIIDPIAKIALAVENNDQRMTLVDGPYLNGGYGSSLVSFDDYEDRYNELIDSISSTIFGDDDKDKDDPFERYR